MTRIFLLTPVLLGLLGCASQPVGCEKDRDCSAGKVCDVGTRTCIAPSADMTLPPDLTPLGDMTHSGLALWSHAFGGMGHDTAFGVAVDKNGEVVVTGVFRGTIDLGGGMLQSAGEGDVFLARFSADGKHLWSHRYGGIGDDQAYGVALDRDGSAVVTGAFQGTGDFGGTALKSNGGYDVFLARYSAAGMHLWSKNFGGPTDDSASGVALDGAGAIAVTGYFTGTANLGSGPLVSAGDADIYLARYDASGKPLWSHRAGGTGYDVGNRVALDADGNAVVVGAFLGSIDFGTGKLIKSAGGADLFVVRYNGAGTVMWASGFGGPGDDVANGVALDGSSAAIVLGTYQVGADLGSGPLPADPYDGFVAKYSATGAPVWSRAIAGNAPIFAGAVTASGGSIGIIGGFNDTLDLGPFKGGGVYVAKLGPDGTTLWARRYAGTGNETGFGVAFTPAGEVVTCGEFEGTLDVGGQTLTSVGDFDSFLVQLKP